MTLLVEDISFQIGRQKLLKSISFELAAGEFVAIIGPNGAGKSTLLKLIAHELPLQSGIIHLNDKSLLRWPKHELAKIRAVLPQQSNLTFGFTALEVVRLGRTPHVQGIETQADWRIVEEAMDLTQTAHLAQRTYPTLSGGERQRVQLARVLAQIWEGTQARYLLLDEPTNNLDLHHQYSTLAIAREFTNKGVSVLAILHDLNLAAQFSDRILLLKEGKCVARGTPQTVLTEKHIQSVFNIPTVVQPHPCLGCPLIIPMPQEIQPIDIKQVKYA